MLRAYGSAPVGSPNHKTLWVLSRTATLPAETLAEAEGRAAAEGFDRGNLAGGAAVIILDVQTSML